MSTAKDWWKDFFQGVTLDLWRAVITEEQTRAEAGCIAKLLQPQPGAKLLDVPCGAGRLCLEFAARGFRLTGVDIAEDFIREARAKTAERKLDIAWENRDMLGLIWREEFDGAFCFGNSFGYSDDEGNAEFLAAVSRSLKPGARLAIDTTAAEAILSHYEERSWSEAGGIIMLEENRYDVARSRYETEYTFIRNGKVEVKKGSQRIYTYGELCRLLEAAGFSETAGYGSTNLEPFGLGAHRLVLVTTKKTR